MRHNAKKNQQVLNFLIQIVDSSEKGCNMDHIMLTYNIKWNLVITET
jgi:hypothetical protein